MNTEREKTIIGCKELIDFPQLGLEGIDAKIDTGAFTSVLHCHDIREEKGVLYFYFLDPSHPEYNNVEQKFTEYLQREIKNSFGEIENRYLIKTIIKIGNRKIKSVISLTDRGTMRHPVLIGRRLLKNKFIVDVSLQYCFAENS